MFLLLWWRLVCGGAFEHCAALALHLASWGLFFFWVIALFKVFIYSFRRYAYSAYILAEHARAVLDDLMMGFSLSFNLLFLCSLSFSTLVYLTIQPRNLASDRTGRSLAAEKRGLKIRDSFPRDHQYGIQFTDLDRGYWVAVAVVGSIQGDKMSAIFFRRERGMGGWLYSTRGMESNILIRDDAFARLLRWHRPRC